MSDLLSDLLAVLQRHGWTAPSGTASPRPASSGPVFPPYGRSKGMPVAGASAADLAYYASGCERSLADPGKARWHDKERSLLEAIRDEQAKAGPPPHTDADAPVEPF